MTTEHVSVPRELACRLENELGAMIAKSDDADKGAITALCDLSDILSRATPSTPCAVTADQLADAFECFGNAAIGAMHSGTNDVCAIAQVIDAIAARLREIAAAPQAGERG